MKRNNPMRIRRRQSDAKWRASVASCFETLKHLISEKKNKVITKRKASKALILQETDKYITLLEEILPKLLEERNSLMAFTGEECQLIDEVKKDFDMKQRTLFQQSCTGRRRYHIPIDLDIANICELSNETSIETVEQARKQLEEIEQQRNAEKQQMLKKKQLSKVPKTSEKSEKEVAPQSCTLNTIRVRMPVDCGGEIKTEQDSSSAIGNHGFLDNEGKSDDPNSAQYFTYPLTPVRRSCSCEFEASEKRMFSPFSVCMFNECFTEETSQKNVLSIPTPTKSKRVAKRLPFDSVAGCSPMDNVYRYFQLTPLKSSVNATEIIDTSQFQSPLQQSVEERNIEDDLYCTERIETMDLESELSDEERLLGIGTEHTPRIIRRHQNRSFEGKERTFKRRYGRGMTERKPKCRRQLEMDFPQDENILDEKGLPVINGVFQNDECLDFDSYFLFYQHVAEQYQSDHHISMEDIRDPKFAAMVSEMWQKMSVDQREAMATIAAMEYSQESDNSNLSDDLMHLDVKPLSKSTSSSYLCPEIGFELPAIQNNQVVPSSEDITIHSDKSTFRPLPTEKRDIVDDDDLQIVPSHVDVSEEDDWCGGVLSNKSVVDISSDPLKVSASETDEKYACFVDITSQRVPDLSLLEEVGVVELEVATNKGLDD